jgi:hypothetical protein
MKNIDVVIAIDPDVERNGFARLDVATRKMELSAIPFPELIAYLRAHKHHYDSKDMTLRVVIEAGWLNRGNWHLNPRDTKAVIAAKGNQAGRNHETGRKIAEMCRYFEIPHELIKPLTKVWKGRERKISAREFNAITGYSGRTNQEMRDAGLIAWVWAGLPIKL